MQIGPAAPEALQALVTALGDADSVVRWAASAAAEALGAIGAAATEAVPALRAARSDTEADVRQAASDALKRIEPASA